MTIGRTDVASTRLTWLRGALLACGVAAIGPTAYGATFSARSTHRGIVIDASGDAGMLVPNGWLRRSGEPAYVYRAGGVSVAGVWTTGPDTAVVRSGLTEDAPVIGRVVPSWKDNALSLSIEPATGDPVRTGAFGEVSFIYDDVVDVSPRRR